jgi:hypothetical protein
MEQKSHRRSVADLERPVEPPAPAGEDSEEKSTAGRAPAVSHPRNRSPLAENIHFRSHAIPVFTPTQFLSPTGG